MSQIIHWPLWACVVLALTSHRPSHHHLACARLWSPLSLVLSANPNQSKDACARATALNIIYKTVSVESTVISHIFWEWCAFVLYLNYFYLSSLSTFLNNKHYNGMTNTFYSNRLFAITWFWWHAEFQWRASSEN